MLVRDPKKRLTAHEVLLTAMSGLVYWIHKSMSFILACPHTDEERKREMETEYRKQGVGATLLLCTKMEIKRAFRENVQIMRLGFDWDSTDINILLLAKFVKPLMGTSRIVINNIHIKGEN
ncbi:hypothetical protein CsSME_00023680 [Camellia sinensis var. sinensis]